MFTSKASSFFASKQARSGWRLWSCSTWDAWRRHAEQHLLKLLPRSRFQKRLSARRDWLILVMDCFNCFGICWIVLKVITQSHKDMPRGCGQAVHGSSLCRFLSQQLKCILRLCAGGCIVGGQEVKHMQDPYRLRRLFILSFCHLRLDEIVECWHCSHPCFRPLPRSFYTAVAWLCRTSPRRHATSQRQHSDMVLTWSLTWSWHGQVC